MNRKFARWVVQAVIFGWACIAPLQTLAQLSSGSLIVTITAPAGGSTVGGTTTVSASVSIIGSLTVAGVQFKLDGANLGSEDTSEPYSVPWNTKATNNGSHTLTAVARDLLGLTFTSDPVTVTVFNDTTSPSITITSPANGASVSGTISVTANASDNVGVIGVQFSLDGASLGAEDTSAPYSVSWNTTAASNGSHTLTAIARDAAGNKTSSSPVTVTVSNDTLAPSVSITSPANGATVSATIEVTADASDNVGVAGVQFRLDDAPLGAEDTSAPYSVSWDTTTANDGAHTLTAVVRDTTGNTAASAAVSVTVSNAPPPDTTPPSVAITAPAEGATVSGEIMVSADAADDSGVAGVQFLVDGVAVGAEDTAAPYSIAWDTTTAPDGSHMLTAVARDAAGNSTTSASVSVTVSNAGAEVTRFEETAAAFSGTGWTRRGAEIASFSGGSAGSSNVAGDSVSFMFTGTAISWIGLKCNVCGISTASIDGGPASTIDTAGAAVPGSPGLASEVVFTASGLSAGEHTLTITVTGTTTSTDAHIVIDAFDVTGAAGGPTTTRIEDSDPAVTYAPAGDWVFLTDSRATAGTAVESQVAGAVATLTFTGTEVRWIGYHFSGGGIARVSIDGVFLGEVDQYSPGEVLQAESFAAIGLERGTHTLTIEVTGTKRPESVNTWVLIDAFDVTP
jgi:hypothetical protein